MPKKLPFFAELWGSHFLFALFLTGYFFPVSSVDYSSFLHPLTVKEAKCLDLFFHLLHSLPRGSQLDSTVLNTINMLINSKSINLSKMSHLNSSLISPSSYPGQLIWMSTLHLKIKISKITPDKLYPSTKSTLPQNFLSSGCSDQKLEKHP